MTYTEKRLEEFDERCLIVRARGKGEGKFRPVVYWDNEEQEDAENIKSFLIASITQALAEDRERLREVIKEKSRKYKKRIEHFNVPDIGRERAKIVYERNLVLSGKQSACDDLLSSLDKSDTEI